MLKCENIPKKPGVYRIYFENLSYVGAATNIQNRMWKHRSYLNSGTHSNTHMQRVYNKHPDLFIVEILEIANNSDRNALLDMETFYHKKYNSVEGGFNSDYPRMISRKFTLTEEQIKKAISKNCKKVIAFNRFTGELYKEFNSLTEAAKELQLETTNISQVCNDRIKYAGGYVFCYSNNYDSTKIYSHPLNHGKGVSHSENHIRNMVLNHAKSLKVFVYDSEMNFIDEYISRRTCEKTILIPIDSIRYKIDKRLLWHGYYFFSTKQ